MSHASAAVRFPDGEIRYTLYDGTSDIMNAALFDTVDEAWNAKRTARMWQRGEGTQRVWDVEIYSDYGGGFWWLGTATKTDIIKGCNPWGWDDGSGRIEIHHCHKGAEPVPAWLDWKYQKSLVAPEGQKDGVPESEEA